ncbi:MAG: hypothetical protein EBQ65_08435 [Chitinophagaceae bacterium]|jgi:hypothetical protein|nr:hypothetical protein [Chitinophagaceae bacterium]NBY25664.1 hypothetical protein [Chitinophagaceae bacterium]
MKLNLTWLGVSAGLLLAIGCWMPWVIIESQNLVITGMQTVGTSYGKPGVLHLIFFSFYLLFTLIPKIWAKRFNILVVALNASWMIRNFLIIGICRGGECPERQIGLYLVAIASVLMLVAALFPSLKEK